jgi:MFS transporter, ACS family, hexuronate transporter
MKKITGLRWWVVGLIAAATVINYIDRTSLAVMWPSISKELDLNKDDYATIVSVFMIAYALGQAISGRLLDWLGTRIGFLLSISVWSFACAMHGLARSIVSYSFFRGLLGMSEAGNWPGATKANAEWFPVNERALAQGIFNAGASLGAVISAPAIAFLYLMLGWKATFIVIGLLGFLWLIPWLIIYKTTPDKHPWITEEERSYIRSGPTLSAAGTERTLSWKELLAHRQSWSVIVSRFFLDPIWWFFVNWLPIYLAEAFGFDIMHIGMFAWVPFLGAAIGSIAGGWYSGHMIQRGWSVDKARKRAILIGGIITLPAFILTAFASSPVAAVVLMAAVLCGFQIMINNIQTLPSDFFSGKSVGTLAGVGGMSAVVGVLVFSTWLIPFLSKISYVPVFFMGAILVPLGVASVFYFGGCIQRLDIEIPGRENSSTTKP